MKEKSGTEKLKYKHIHKLFESDKNKSFIIWFGENCLITFYFKSNFLLDMSDLIHNSHFY